MIEINLLPPEYRKRQIQLPDLGKIKLAPVIIGIFSFLIGLYLILSIISAAKGRALNRLEREWQAIFKERERAEELKERMQQLKKKSDLIDNLFINRLLWARKLNQLSDLLIDGIWFESLSLEKRKETEVLILKGNVFSRKKEETALIGNFMQKLRQDKDFFSDFKEIELESIKRRKLGETEIMEFNLVLFFREKT